MALVVISNQFTDDQNRTLNFPFFSGYDRVKFKQTIEIEFSYVIDPANSLLKVGDSFTLQNGATWEQYGFFVGADISGNYENGSTHNIPALTTILNIDGATMWLSNTLAGTDGVYTIGTLTLDEVAQSIGFDFNLVENTSTGSEFSVIDGEVNRFNADVSALAVSGTVTPSQLGNKSGGSQLTTLIRRIADVGGKRRYEIEISFNPWTVKDSDLYFSTSCVKPWINVKAYPEFQNVAVFLQNIWTPSDANTGLTGEVGNGGAPNYTLQYCNFKDSNSNPTSAISFNDETTFEIRVNGVFSSSSKYNLVCFYDAQDDSDFKNLPTDFDQNHLVLKNNGAIPMGSHPDIQSASRPDSVDLTITDVDSTQFGTYAIFTGKFTPNSNFTSFMQSKDTSNRAYKFWIRVENPTLTANNVRPVWLPASENSFSEIVVPLGKYGIGFDIIDHSNEPTDETDYIIKEDDVNILSEFTLPKFNEFTQIKAGFKVGNSVTGESFDLESYFVDLSALPQLPDGTKPINFTVTRPFSLSPSNENNIVKIARNPLMDDSSNYGVRISYSALMRWESWLQQLGTALAFYGNSTKDWIQYITGDWGLVYAVEIATPNGVYQDFEVIDLKDYDDWRGSTLVEYFREDGITAITKPIIGENTHVKITFTHPFFTAVSTKWAQMTVESFEQSPRWDLSSVYDWGSVTQNPLKPLTGETGLKVTSSVGSVVIEGLLDVTKLPNPNKISITGRLFADEKRDINPNVRHKVTTETVRLPREIDQSDRGDAGNCCDCKYTVFADEFNTESYRNHVSSRWQIGESVVFELYKNGQLASFQPTAQSFPNDASAFYCTIPWRDVLVSDGQGCYVLKSVSTSAGIDVVSTLGVFELHQFTWEKADGLICVRSVFNDANIKEQINFTNALVMDCWVTDGDIEEYQPTTEITKLVKADYTQEKVKHENRTRWTINVDFADFCHMKRLTDIHLLGANQLFISDYRKDAFDKTILDKPVALAESSTLTPIYRSERQKATFQVEDRIVDSISRYGFVNASGEVNLSEIPLPNVTNIQTPIDVTINDILVLDDITTDQNLTLKDQDGNEVAFTQVGNDLEVKTDWYRPFDWLPMPNVLITDQKFVGLHAVFENHVNYVAFSFTTSSGQYLVDWGDGNTSLVNSGVIAQHQYNYSTYDVTNSTLSFRGYKQAIITVTPVSGNLLTCNFQQRYVTSPIQNQPYSSGFLDCILSMPNASVGQSIIFGGGTIRHGFVERFTIKTIGNSTSTISMFNNCFSLQSAPLFNTVNVNNMANMFSSCYSLQSVPLFNTINVTNMANMFINCTALQSVPLFNTVNVTNMASMFASCTALKSVPLFNTINVTNMTSMFFSCLLLQSVPLFNTINVTNVTSMFSSCHLLQSVPLFNTINVTNMTSMFSNCRILSYIPAFVTASNSINLTTFSDGCNSLNKVDMVFRNSVSLINCQLSKEELVNIFTNLIDRTSLTSANINITENWGASALTPADRAIATSKNWTISG